MNIFISRELRDPSALVTTGTYYLAVENRQYPIAEHLVRTRTETPLDLISYAQTLTTIASAMQTSDTLVSDCKELSDCRTKRDLEETIRQIQGYVSSLDAN